MYFATIFEQDEEKLIVADKTKTKIFYLSIINPPIPLDTHINEMV